LSKQNVPFFAKINEVFANIPGDTVDFIEKSNHRVWKGGVNEAYLNFIASKPAPSISAVPLSII
jgi:hypothetical protein